MNTAEIIRNHIAKRNLNITPQQFYKQIELALQQPRTKMLRSGDVLFLFSIGEDNSALTYIINGSGPVGYLKAVKQYVAMIRRFGIKYIKMRVADTQAATKIANAADLRNVKFDMFKEGATDPYMMIAEI